MRVEFYDRPALCENFPEVTRAFEVHACKGRERHSYILAERLYVEAKVYPFLWVPLGQKSYLARDLLVHGNFEVECRVADFFKC
jgi:hypothetical protein